MGYYIQTDSDKDKADWIRANLQGIMLTGCPNHVGEEYVPVCIVDNGSFEAAGIAFSRGEAEAFAGPSDDKRKKIWMIIKREHAIAIHPELEDMIDW